MATACDGRDVTCKACIAKGINRKKTLRHWLRRLSGRCTLFLGSECTAVMNIKHGLLTVYERIKCIFESTRTKGTNSTMPSGTRIELNLFECILKLSRLATNFLVKSWPCTLSESRIRAVWSFAFCYSQSSMTGVLKV